MFKQFINHKINEEIFFFLKYSSIKLNHILYHFKSRFKDFNDQFFKYVCIFFKIYFHYFSSFYNIVLLKISKK